MTLEIQNKTNVSKIAIAHKMKLLYSLLRNRRLYNKLHCSLFSTFIYFFNIILKKKKKRFKYDRLQHYKAKISFKRKHNIPVLQLYICLPKYWQMDCFPFNNKIWRIGPLYCYTIDKILKNKYETKYVIKRENCKRIVNNIPNIIYEYSILSFSRRQYWLNRTVHVQEVVISLMDISIVFVKYAREGDGKKGMINKIRVQIRFISVSDHFDYVTS